MNGPTGSVTSSGRRAPAETRSEILAAARAFLWDHPFRELTVGRLMDATSVGRSTFYLHFSDAYELAAALLVEIDDEMERATRSGRSSVEFPRNVDQTLAAAVDVWERNGPILRAIAEASTQDGALDDLYRKQIVQRSIDRVCVALEQAQVRGAADRSLDAHEIATLLILMFDHYLSDRLGRHPQADAELLHATLVAAWRRILGIEHYN